MMMMMDDGDDDDDDDDDAVDDDDDDYGGDDDDNELVLAKLRSCCVGRCAASLSPEGEASLGIEIDQRSNHDQGDADYHSLRITSKLITTLTIVINMILWKKCKVLLCTKSGDQLKEKN